ncbi:MAG: ion transporter [Pseudomonadota bacterium]
MSIRKALYRQLDPSARSKPGLSFINLTIVVLVLASFLVFALETEPTIGGEWRTGVRAFNIAILVIFAVEYAARVWTSIENPKYRSLTGRLRYMALPYPLADLVAFLPELLWLILAPAGSDEEMIMLLRVLRLARLVKIARFVPAFDAFGAAMRRAGGQLLAALALALVLVYVSAVVLYLIEGVQQGREAFGSIPRSIWWAIATLTTVGYGDVYPVTVLGRVAASIIAITGIGVVALPAGVFASAFSDELRERELKKLKERVRSDPASGDDNAPKKN